MAAPSLTDSMKELEAAHGHPAPRFVVAVPSVLAPQVEYGAPKNIVVSADEPRALLAFLTAPDAAPAHRKLGCSIRL